MSEIIINGKKFAGGTIELTSDGDVIVDGKTKHKIPCGEDGVLKIDSLKTNKKKHPPVSI
jgi:hypothetical protein